MPRSIDGALEYAYTHPQRDGGSWAGWCESFVFRAGGFTQSFGSAMLAGNASGPLNPDWSKAPRGAIHYWAGVAGDGHVAFELGGGSLLMASNATWTIGTALGTVPFQSYAKLGIPYRGWSFRHGNETLAGAGTAGGNESEIDMAEEASVQEAIRIANVNYTLLLQIAAAQKDDATAAQVNEAIRIGNESWSLVKQIQAKPSAVVDTVKLAAELAKLGTGAPPTPAQIAAAVDLSLADNFKGIPAAVNADAAKRLSS